MKIDLDNTLEFLDFVVERHAMYERRQAGLPQDQWTDHPTLATRKFTNVFRWLDPGSQFVITDLLPDVSRRDALFRCTLYRYTNWPDTWRWLRSQFGHYPTEADLPWLAEAIKVYREQGNQVFSGAYMIIPQPGRKGDKVEMVVDLAARVTDTSAHFLTADTQAERHAALMEHFGVGKFLAQQILTDFMYEFGDPETENEFVAEGPGSWKGAGVIAPGQNTVEVIHWAHEALVNLPACPTVGGKQPSLMDVQNCLCEMSKFVRGPRNNVYHPAHPGPLPEPVVPTAYRR